MTTEDIERLMDAGLRIVPRTASLRVCAGCGATERETEPCAGWNYADAHLLGGAVPDYCGPFEPETPAPTAQR